jgi:primosomal protein N' (replication factor Y)
VQCHTCGFADSAPTSCESCSSADIVFRSIGTKSIVEELKRLFPKAVIQRFDSDNTKADSLEEQYEDVKNGKFDIIVGTQMLSKGLDLPGLTVVGIVVADTGLYFPDFTAEERTYQMLSQVIGRVGRGHNASQVIVQTYHPDSATIQAAITKNYPVFYEQQLAERKMFGFPPFRYVLKLSCRRATSKSASQNAEKLVDMLRTQNLVVEIVGPSPAFTERTNNQFNWQIVVKSTRRSELTRVIDLLPAGWTYDIDPSNLL